MPPTLIDLNDVELRIARGIEEIFHSPGYATLVDQRVEIGERGYAEAWRHPRHTSNRYWHLLDTAPLRHLGRRVRHSGDLAWMQLEQLQQRAGRPTQAVLIVPAIYQRPQLNLLLGIASAANLRVDDVVESPAAVGAALPDGHYQHIETCLHQTVVSRLEVAGARAQRTEVTLLGELGYVEFERRIIACIVDSFLVNCRFDALHDGATEQLLHSQLGQWLSLLGDRPEIVLTIDHRGVRHEAPLRAETVMTAIAPLRSRLARAAGSDATLVDHRLARLPGLLDGWPNATALSPLAALLGCAYSPDLAEPSPGGPRIRQGLARVEAGHRLSTRHAGLPRMEAGASHLLARDVAYRLSSRPWFLSRSGQLQREPQGDCVGEVMRRDTGPCVRANAGQGLLLNGHPVDGTVVLRVGDHLTVAGAACLFVLIAVQDEDAAQA